MLPLLVELLRERFGFETTLIYKLVQLFDPIRSDGVMFRAVAALICSFVMVLLLGKRTIRWLLKQKIGDAPEFYNKDLNALSRHKANTPTMGGILIAGAIFASVLLLADVRVFYVQMAMVCLVWLAGVGGADDWLKLTSARRNPGSREGLFMWEKLVFQVGIALLLGLFIHFHGSDSNPQTHILNLPGLRTFMPGTTMLDPGVIVLGTWMFGILAVIVISGSSNAVNLTDGMDGLASGIMVVVSFAFMLLCLIAGSDDWAPRLLVPHIPTSQELAIVAAAMCGACLGFLWFNCHPAQVFMGDTGSLPLGGLIGYIAVVTRQEILLLIIGGVVFVEMGSVILQVGYFKLSKGSRIFKCAPIHHHFHLSGWSEQQVVVRFWLITAVLTAIALATIKLR